MEENKNNKEKVDQIFKGSDVMILLEDVRSDMRVLADGQVGLREGTEEFRVEMTQEIRRLGDSQNNLKTKILDLKEGQTAFEKRTEENFSAVFEYLTKIEDEITDIKNEIKEIRSELKSEVSIKKVEKLEKRIEKIEKDLAQQRKLAAV